MLINGINLFFIRYLRQINVNHFFNLVILIDNFNIQETKEAVAVIGDRCQTESSGGIDEVTLRHYAECGVDFISSGALTHSVYNMDLSLKAVE